MAYIGTDPNLIDLQNQINNLQTQLNNNSAGLQTQIKQVTLTLEGLMRDLQTSFDALQEYVNSRS